MMRPTVDVKPANLSGTDRKNFYDIVDKLTGCTYEHARATSSANADKNGPSAEGPSGQPSWDGGGVT